MAQYDAQAIQQTIRDAKRLAKMDVVYVSGQWYSETTTLQGGIQRRLVSNILAFHLDTLLQQHQADIAVDQLAQAAQQSQSGGGGSGASGGGASGGGGSGGGSGSSGGAFNTVFRGRSTSRVVSRGLASLLQNGAAGIAAGSAALGLTYGNIRGAESEGEAAATNLVSGFRSGIGALASAGAEAATTLISSFLQPFGASGAAAGKLIGRGGSAIGNLLSMGGDVAGGVAGMGGRVIGLGAGLAGAAGGAGLGLALGGPAGMLAGLAAGSGFGALVAHGLEAITSLFGSFISAAGKAAGEIGGVVAEGISSAIEILKDAIQSALSYSKTALSLAHTSGLSIGQSMEAVNVAGALGVDTSAIPRGNSLMRGMMARAMYGGNGTGGMDDVSAFRAMYRPLAQRGGMSLMMAQMRARASGMEGYEDAAILPDNLFHRQVNTSASLTRSLGMNPQEIELAGQNFKGLMDLVTQGIDLLKNRVASEALPYLTSMLGKTVNYITSHAGAISDGIKSATKWIFETAPPLILRGTASLLSGFGDFLSDLSRKVPAILGALDSFLNGLRGFIAEMIGFTVMFNTPFSEASKEAQKADRELPKGTPGLLRSTLVGGAYANTLVGYLTGNGPSAMEAGQKAVQGFYDIVPESNLSAMYSKSLSRQLGNAAGLANDYSKQLNDAANGYQSNMNQSSIDENTAVLKEIRDLLKERPAGDRQGVLDYLTTAVTLHRAQSRANGP